MSASKDLVGGQLASLLSNFEKHGELSLADGSEKKEAELDPSQVIAQEIAARNAATKKPNQPVAMSATQTRALVQEAESRCVSSKEKKPSAKKDFEILSTATLSSACTKASKGSGAVALPLDICGEAQMKDESDWMIPNRSISPELEAALLHCRDHGKQYVDTDFPANDLGLFTEPLPSDQKAKYYTLVKSWKRISEISENPVIIPSGRDASRISTSGLIDNDWLLGTLATLSVDASLIAGMFECSQYSEDGVYAVRCFLKGEWKSTLIDDQLPCNAEGKPAFIRCENPNEFWAPLLEKAFAKLYGGSYSALGFGTAKNPESIVFRILLGEVPLPISVPEDIPRESLVPYLRTRRTTAQCLAAVTRAPGDVKKMHNGLCTNRLYPIISFHTTGGGVQLVKLRQPYTDGGAWSEGQYSFGSPLWTGDFCCAIGQKSMQGAKDHFFYMNASEFADQFNTFMCCKTSPEQWNDCTHIEDEWERAHAGGPCDLQSWSNNSQFELVLNRRSSILVRLGQQDLLGENEAGQENTGYTPCCVYIIKSSGIPGYHLPVCDRDQIIIGHEFGAHREWRRKFTLEAGRYLVVPCTLKPNVIQDYSLTILSEQKTSFRRIHALECHRIEGAWRIGKSAGGLRGKPTFESNPQFELEVNYSTDIFISLSTPKFPHLGIVLYLFHVTDPLFSAEKGAPTIHHRLIAQSRAVAGHVWLHVRIHKPDGGRFVIVPATQLYTLSAAYQLLVYSDAPPLIHSITSCSAEVLGSSFENSDAEHPSLSEEKPAAAKTVVPVQVSSSLAQRRSSSLLHIKSILLQCNLRRMQISSLKDLSAIIAAAKPFVSVKMQVKSLQSQVPVAYQPKLSRRSTANFAATDKVGKLHATVENAILNIESATRGAEEYINDCADEKIIQAMHENLATIARSLS